MSKIINILKERKSIPLDQFINISLYDKKSGYYMKKNPFGKEGDFITSPLISNLFSEMLAIWCVSYWERLGKPSKILLVKIGSCSWCKFFTLSRKLCLSTISYIIKINHPCYHSSFSTSIPMPTILTMNLKVCFFW